MKKILCFALIIVLALSLGACMPRNSGPKVQKVTDPTNAEDIVAANYEDSLRGACDYMTDLGYIYALPESTGDEMKDPLAMNAGLIGADEGYKFTCDYDGSTINVEIYSFSKTDGKYYQQGKKEGKVTLSNEIESGTFEVTFSGNGKYMMVYDDSADRAERKNAAVKAFEAFYA